ncbi:MAG TPA: glutaredoxin domain-containing protein [Pseudomonadales bacterium]|nr:glutaredoxin domain-containing protein [Pseudomonadales bacterium]
MTRKTLDHARIHPAIESEIGGSADFRRTVDEVEKTIAGHAIVIVGMNHNPFPKKARQLLDAQGIAYHYLEYGNYFSEWKRRGALKMWSGWQTFPMIFVKGQLIGGFSNLKQLVDSGELKSMLQ